LSQIGAFLLAAYGRWSAAAGICVLLMAAGAGREGMPNEEIPSQYPESRDPKIERHIRDMRDWAARAFAGRGPAEASKRVKIEVIQQDHSVLNFGQSCIDTPIVIGKQSFQHGLGAHANSVIAVAVPPGAKAFKAFVGIDNNDDTQGARGTVAFSVAAGSDLIFKTDVLRGGGDPVPVLVDLPKGSDRLLLKADATEDGAAHDQADWADAQFVMEDGTSLWLDADQPDLFFVDTRVPFSFVYGGQPSSDLLKQWPKQSETREEPGRIIDTISWTDPGSELRVTTEVATYTEYPAVDWVVWFENKGPQDTPIIEDMQALDVMLRTGYARKPTVLDRLEGDACGESSFMPKDSVIEVDKSLRLAPTGGRPSSISAFPWFNIQYGDQGLITAVGWTGQWAAQFDRTSAGPTRIRAGIEKTRLLLHEGERIRGPRIVMLSWRGDRVAAHNRFRRLVLFHYVPKLDGKPLRLPVALQTFDRYNARLGWATEAGQINAAETAHAFGCDTYWLDAAWFPGNFPNGVGNWFCKPAEFPNSLKPVSDVCHKNGLRFVLWFEPERVAKDTQIANEHPEHVFGGKQGGLFKLNEPQARKFLTELLSKRISEYGIDIYRNDFNIDPLDFWRKNDPPDRQGMTEIQYVMGLYEMWDELRAWHPGLAIDNCSSGGRRIDIEMCSRSMPLWRSDTSCSPGHPDWNQVQAMGLSQYVPLHTACVWSPEPYEVRSASTGGLLCQFDYLNPDFPAERAKQLIEEAKDNQKYWYGDFYALTPCTLSPEAFVAYQLHRPDLNEGLVLAFRRADCNYLGLILGLSGIDASAQYDVVTIDEKGEKTTRTLSGPELTSDLQLRIPDRNATLVLRYKKL